MAASVAWRELRALRFDPPGYAKTGGRRTTFQAALEQCEQFMGAAGTAGYATKPVQLFYALSQAGLAIVAASPRISNQAWSPHGHGLTTGYNAGTDVAGVTVAATISGLFPSVAQALGVDPLVPDDAVPLRDLWPLLPETVEARLTPSPALPALLFFPSNWREDRPFGSARVDWVPTEVRARCGEDPVLLQEFLSQYPSLREARPRKDSGARSYWSPSGFGLLQLNMDWRTGEPPLLLVDSKTLTDLGVARYGGSDDTLVTPALGAMTGSLHPQLALWAVLLALSSLARYEPARWAKAIDVDRSAEASAIEHLMNEVPRSIPAAVLRALRSFQ